VRDIIESLIRLQELELILTESRILHAGEVPASVAELETVIEDNRRSIDKTFLKRYDMLRRNGMGVTQEIGGVCGGCRLNVNQGDLNRMRRGEMTWACPNCGRFLLLSGDK
jgi:predicted  nucleic acid-binding Zn-ribbon protein